MLRRHKFVPLPYTIDATIQSTTIPARQSVLVNKTNLIMCLLYSNPCCFPNTILLFVLFGKQLCTLCFFISICLNFLFDHETSMYKKTLCQSLAQVQGTPL